MKIAGGNEKGNGRRSNGGKEEIGGAGRQCVEKTFWRTTT